MDIITEIVSGLGKAITTFVPNMGEGLVEGFNSLFITTTGETSTLTYLAYGLLALAGVSIAVACVRKVYSILSGRVRKSA